VNGHRTRRVQATPVLRLGLHLQVIDPACLTRSVGCDMKLHSVLLGGAILTKPCVCPQVLHGSMRLMGCPEVGATVRGMKPSR